MTSGIATMSREIVLGTCHFYDWVQLGAAMNHPELGKIVNIDADVRKISGNPNATLKIIPSNGYGDIMILRKLIKEERPDAILHFTDPHYWQWLYDAEHEVRQEVPLLFYHIWDDLPDPQYNRDYYESCDWIGCISKQTYGIVNRVGKRNNVNTFKPLEDWQIDYVPHGINKDVFKILDKVSDEIYNLVHGKTQRNFVLFYNNRNIRRKQPADVIYCYKLFCDMLPKKESEKCLLLMHTNPIDENGTDLIAVKNDLCPDYDVMIMNSKVDQQTLNQFYNVSDCTINIANNEGFGLATAESIMAGTPIIVNVTGGLQDQCGFNIEGVEFTDKDYIKLGTLNNKNKWNFLSHGSWVNPVWPSSNTINGSPLTPYIFEDKVNHDDVVEAIMKMYQIGRDGRKKRGVVGREWAIKNLSSDVMCKKMIDGIDKSINNFKKRDKFNLYKIV
jgi:glycosyltransferase involved in cell wall biosynthesis